MVAVAPEDAEGISLDLPGVWPDFSTVCGGPGLSCRSAAAAGEQIGKHTSINSSSDNARQIDKPRVAGSGDVGTGGNDDWCRP